MVTQPSTSRHLLCVQCVCACVCVWLVFIIVTHLGIKIIVLLVNTAQAYITGQSKFCNVKLIPSVSDPHFFFLKSSHPSLFVMGISLFVATHLAC